MNFKVLCDWSVFFFENKNDLSVFFFENKNNNKKLSEHVYTVFMC